MEQEQSPRGSTLPPGHELVVGYEPSISQPIDLDRKGTLQKVFVELLAEGCSLSEAANALGINRSTVFRWRQDDPEFATRCKEAFKASVDVLKREAERRALKGSDKLLMFLLERYDPGQFHIAQKLEHSGAVDLASAILAARKRVSQPEPGDELC